MPDFSEGSLRTAEFFVRVPQVLRMIRLWGTRDGMNITSLWLGSAADAGEAAAARSQHNELSMDPRRNAATEKGKDLGWGEGCRVICPALPTLSLPIAALSPPSHRAGPPLCPSRRSLSPRCGGGCATLDSPPRSPRFLFSSSRGGEGRGGQSEAAAARL